MPQDTTKEEILEAIHDFANHTEKRFDTLESDVSSLKSDVSSLKSDVSSLKSQMVTKDYLDDKLSDLKGDLIVLIRKEDTKLAALVEILKERKVIDDNDIKKILAMEPFPKSH